LNFHVFLGKNWPPFDLQIVLIENQVFFLVKTPKHFDPQIVVQKKCSSAAVQTSHQ
jgi:hypothetical protein